MRLRLVLPFLLLGCGPSRSRADLDEIQRALDATSEQAGQADEALKVTLSTLSTVRATQATCPHTTNQILLMDHGMDRLERRVQNILLQTPDANGTYRNAAAFFASKLQTELREPLPSAGPDPVLERARHPERELNPYRIYAALESGTPIRLVGDRGFVPGTASGAMYLYDRRVERVVCVGSWVGTSGRTVTSRPSEALGAIHLDAKVRGVLSGLPTMRLASSESKGL